MIHQQSTLNTRPCTRPVRFTPELQQLPPGLELIFGLGLLRKSWSQGPPLRQAVLQRLQQLAVPWALVDSNAGRVRVTPGVTNQGRWTCVEIC